LAYRELAKEVLRADGIPVPETLEEGETYGG
jgi:hypothetical protein